MNPEEALKQFDEWNESGWSKSETPSSEALILSIQALEKQIPIKPRYYIDNWGHNRPGCPRCQRNEVLYAGQKYCKVCGTKIDWEETP